MSYCRFENTAEDLRDCIDAINNGEINSLSKYEQGAFVDLVMMAKEISEMYQHLDEQELNEFITNANPQDEDED